MNTSQKTAPHCSRLAKIALLALLSLAILPACESSDDAKASPAGNSFNVNSATLVQTVEAARGEPFVVKGDYAGEFVAERTADVAFEVSGRVLTLNYDIGDHVEKDAVLAKINDTVHRQKVREASAAVKMAQANIGEAEISVQDLESNLKRKRPLLERQLISEREIEDLEAQLSLARQQQLVATAGLEQAQARLQSAREDLRNTEIRAPFNAQVAARLVDLGSYVGPAQPAFRLISEDGLYLRVNIPEQDAGHIAVDTHVTVRIAALGGVEFGATVTRVAPIIDPTTRMMRADITLQPTEAQQELIERVRPGMYAQVQVELGRRDDAVTIPRQSLVQARGGANFVWVIKGDSAHQQNLTLGLQGRDHVEVLSGLEGGESVVLRGGGSLQQGEKVTVQNPTSNSAAQAEQPDDSDTPSAPNTEGAAP